VDRKELIIHSRFKDLGGFSVHRTLPSAQLRSLGPFVFLDRVGPFTTDADHLLSVRPHPHIGLSTVTYLFEGQGYHRDSLGSQQIINPGDINLMTAGKGIVHSERSPEPLEVGKTLNGIQIWKALPKDQEECEPQFAHWPKESFPQVKLADGATASILMGAHQGVTSPLVAPGSLFLDCRAETGVNLQQSFQALEAGVLVVQGACVVDGHEIQENDLISVANPQKVALEAPAGSRWIVLGGTPFPEPRYIWWNFVSSRKERIRQAAEDWKNQRMGRVAGEKDFIPLPSDPLP
jgi:redox-sensitive bicupin YhaK (pirin superfamily)